MPNVFAQRSSFYAIVNDPNMAPKGNEQSACLRTDKDSKVSIHQGNEQSKGRISTEVVGRTSFPRRDKGGVSKADAIAT